VDGCPVDLFRGPSLAAAFNIERMGRLDIAEAGVGVLGPTQVASKLVVAPDVVDPVNPTARPDFEDPWMVCAQDDGHQMFLFATHDVDEPPGPVEVAHERCGTSSQRVARVSSWGTLRRAPKEMSAVKLGDVKRAHVVRHSMRT
jgi:hypothetical protein